MGKSSRQRISKETAELNSIIDQMDLTDIYRTFNPTTAECTFFSSTHGIFSQTDHVVGRKTTSSQLKKIEIIPSIFCDHNGMKLEMNDKRKTEKFMNTWKLNSSLPNNQWVKEEVKGK